MNFFKDIFGTLTLQTGTILFKKIINRKKVYICLDNFEWIDT